ncbi:MAG: hypothetical protein GXO49_04665 [Chlorobi bacterium]|nr:hypothetical protein [Chlorobiota bacterium]
MKTLNNTKKEIKKAWDNYFSHQKSELKKIAHNSVRLDDLIVRNIHTQLFETFLEWQVKAKTDSQKEILDELIKNAMTLMSYNTIKDERNKYLVFEREQIEKKYLEVLKENTILQEHIKELEQKLSKSLE